MPEVQGLVQFLADRLTGATLTVLQPVAFTALKSVAIAPDALLGGSVIGADRHGKWLDLVIATQDGRRHLIFHLARAGWLRWYDTLPNPTGRPSPKSPVALRVGSDRGGFALTEAGTRRKLAVFIVADPAEVPMIATLGVDPLSPAFTAEQLGVVLRTRNQQIKGLLRDQSRIAGIGNAYSDEILHAARISPFASTRTLAGDETMVTRLHTAVVETLRGAIAAVSGKPARELKDAKRTRMRVHGRTGEQCDTCGDVVREVSFADSSLQYCATCQTGGKVLADRRMSKLLK